MAGAHERLVSRRTESRHPLLESSWRCLHVIFFDALPRRRSLHKYDPPDLHLRQPSQDTITLAPRPCATEEDKAQEEIAQAKAAGLQLDFGSLNVGREAGMFSIGVAQGGDGANANDAAGKEEAAHFEEEAAYQNAVDGGAPGEDSGFLEENDSDSDDDFL